nr:MAG TPA: Calcyclin-binding protein [Caudoviricetes sp.]
MSKNLRDALKNAKDEIKELIASFFEEIEADLDELAELVEQNETEQADDLITEIKQKMDNWLAVQ